jgi:microcystin-dependent protein
LTTSPHETVQIEAWGWMLCDGRLLEVEQYPELFAALGYLYGGSDNSFKIPDYVQVSPNETPAIQLHHQVHIGFAAHDAVARVDGRTSIS